MKKKEEGCWIFVKKGRNAGPILGTRGQILGAKESLNGRKKMARKVNYGDVLYFSSRHFLRKFSLRKSRSRSRSKSACMYFQETAQFLDEFKKPCST